MTGATTATKGQGATEVSVCADLPVDLRQAMEREVVVLDTSALMADSRAHLAYPGCDVVVPLTVVDELDNNKARPDDAGRNGRNFLRSLEQVRLANGGDISIPVALPDGGTVRIEPNGLRLDELHQYRLAADVADHRIIAAALGLRGDGRAVRVVSNDMALRLKASVLGLRAEEHTPGRIGVHAPHRRGHHSLPLSYATIAALKASRSTPISYLPDEDQELLAGVLENEFVVADGTRITARRVGDTLVRCRSNLKAWGARPRNKEQQFALELLLDEDISLVALRGHAGTGKSHLAIASALEAVLERQTHDRILILRPMISVGRQDLGFLPGDVTEKTTPWFAAVVDALVALSDGTLKHQQAVEQLESWIALGKVELAPLTFLRGRSLNHTVVILDEAQNVEPGVVKTVVSRMGEGSKLILTGDDGQLDQPFATALTCGLNVAVDAFAGLDLFGHVFFSKGERSRLADLAAERM